MKTIKLLLFAIAILALPRFASALVSGPYTPDANTVYLFHFDEPAGSYVATNAAGSLAAGTNAVAYSTVSGNTFPGIGVSAPTNFNVLGGTAASGFSFGSFGKAANLANSASGTNGIGIDADKNGGFALSTNSTPFTAYDTIASHAPIFGANNSFTLEALINVSSTNGNQEIICSDNGAVNASRGFQFRLTGPRMEFFFIGAGAGAVSANDMFAFIPSSGSNAFVPNQWFHVAFTHTEIPVAGGTNSVFYWTALTDSNVVANAIATNTVAGVDSSDPLILDIGNEARAAGSSMGSAEGLQGLIDEVRISKVVRTPDQMMFTLPVISISQQPASVSITTNQTATFTVVASGLPPLSYQWYAYPTGGTTNALPNATNSTLSVTSGNSLGVTNYFVVVTNLVSSPATSSVATLTIRLPLNLTWAGVGSTWDTSTANWTTDNNTSQTVYSDPDNVTFNNLGAGQPTVTLAQTLKPVSVTVSENASYTLSGSGLIAGSGSLTMNSSGTLIIDTVNTYTGATTISSGTLQLGDGTTTGTIGSGRVTNNAALVVNPGSGGTVALTNTISGSGSLSVAGSANGTVTLSATNSYSGGTTLSAGVIQANASSALGSGLVTINSGSTVARINPANGVTLANDITLTSGAGGPARGILELADNQSATFTGTIEVDGTPASGGTIAGPVTTGLLGFTGPINGNGQIIIRLGNVRLSGGGNATYIRNDMNTLSIGANNGIPISASLIQSANGVATLDLNGFNQELAGLTLFGANNGIVTNSSASASTLTLNIPSANTYGGVLAGNLKLTKTGGGTLTLTNVNTLTGATLVSAGTLALTGSGSLASTTIAVDSGAVLDVTGRTSSTLNLGTGQVLSGVGTVSGSVSGGGVSPGMSAIGGLTVNGNATLTGLTTFKVNKTSSTSDTLAVSGNVTYGGTLFATNLSGTLNIGDNYTIVTAAGQSGNFSSITGSPGAGKAWSFTNGVLSVVSGIATNPTNIVFSVSGSTLTLSWPADHLGWILQTQTNTLSHGLGTNWVDVPNSGSVTQQVITAMPTNPSVFFRLRSP